MMNDDEFDPGLQSLLDKAKALPSDIAPKPGTWNRIRDRIEGTRVRELATWQGSRPGSTEMEGNSAQPAIAEDTAGGLSRRRWSWNSPRTALLAAAALFVAVVGTAVIREREIPASMQAEAPASSPTATSMTPVFARYDAAASDLTRDLQQRRTRLNPETVAVLDSCLNTIDNAIRESRSALETTPDNATIASLLQVAYEQKLDLLKRAADLPLGSL